MKKLLVLSSIVLVVLLSACGGKSITFDKRAIEIINIHTNEKISHGMSRVETEKILGKGENISDEAFDYEKGVSITYSSNKVRAIGLKSESEGEFETAQGIKVGMLSSEVLKLYGEENNLNDSSSWIEIVYDADKHDYLKSYPNSENTTKDSQLYTLRAYVDDSGYVENFNLTSPSDSVN